MKLLITGAGGGLGSQFLELARRDYPDWECVGVTRKLADLLSPADIKGVISGVKPDCILHAAAMTAVDLCETEPELAHGVNVEGTRAVVEAAEDAGARVVFISTDYVFDGKKDEPYHEKDPTNPLGVYGKTKLMGGKAVLKKCGNAAVLRLSLMGGASFTGRRSLNEVIPQTLKSHGKVSLFKDEYRSPIWADNVAEVIRELLESDFTGLLHVPGGKDYSRYEIGEIIFRRYGLPLDKLQPAWVTEFTGSPPRCPDVTLSNLLVDQVLETPRYDFASGFGRYRDSGET